MCGRGACRAQLYGVTGKDRIIEDLKEQITQKDALVATQAALIQVLQQQQQQQQQQAAPGQVDLLRRRAAKKRPRPALLQVDGNMPTATLPAKQAKKTAPQLRAPPPKQPLRDELMDASERGRRVKAFFASRQTWKGMSIASALPALALQGMSEMCVFQAVRDLLARNEMYSTIDEEHFAVIEESLLM